MSKSRPSIYLNYLLVAGYRHPPRSLSERSQSPDAGSDAARCEINERYRSFRLIFTFESISVTIRIVFGQERRKFNM